MPDRIWVREGFSRWTEPETWLYADKPRGGVIFAKVVYNPDARRWSWCTTRAASVGFVDLETAKAKAESFVRTHEDLMPLNR